MDFVNLNDLAPLIPELIVLLTGITVLFVDLFAPRKNRMTTLAVISLIGIALAMMAEIQLYGYHPLKFLPLLAEQLLSLKELPMLSIENPNWGL